MKRACGLDVHKSTIFCSIYDGKKHGQVKEYSTLTSSIKLMGEALRSEDVKEIAMESTGMYWIPIWNILEDMGFKLMLVNPYLIKQMPGRKSDVLIWNVLYYEQEYNPEQLIVNDPCKLQVK